MPVDDKSGAANQMKQKKAQKHKKMVSISKGGAGPASMNMTAANGNQPIGN